MYTLHVGGRLIARNQTFRAIHDSFVAVLKWSEYEAAFFLMATQATGGKHTYIFPGGSANFVRVTYLRK